MLKSPPLKDGLLCLIYKCQPQTPTLVRRSPGRVCNPHGYESLNHAITHTYHTYEWNNVCILGVIKWALQFSINKCWCHSHISLHTTPNLSIHGPTEEQGKTMPTPLNYHNPHYYEEHNPMP